MWYYIASNLSAEDLPYLTVFGIVLPDLKEHATVESSR